MLAPVPLVTVMSVDDVMGDGSCMVSAESSRIVKHGDTTTLGQGLIDTVVEPTVRLVVPDRSVPTMETVAGSTSVAPVIEGRALAGGGMFPST